MDVLVLGGTRLMGKHLVNALLEKGHRITVATRGITEDVFDREKLRSSAEALPPEYVMQAVDEELFYKCKGIGCRCPF